MKEPATKIDFDDTAAGLPLIGLGVRKKAILKVYAVGMYSDANLPAKSDVAGLTAAVGAAGKTVVQLKMHMKVAADKIAGSFSDGVGARASDKAAVEALKNLIVAGLPGGQATPGTVIQFDCEGGAVSVSVDGKAGDGKAEGVAQAVLDMFLDKNTVVPTLQKDCLAKCK